MSAELLLTGAARRIEGPLLFLERSAHCGLHDAVEVSGADGRSRLGRVVALDEKSIVVELHDPTRGLTLAETRVRFLGRPLMAGLGPGLLGRLFDGAGVPIDGGPPVALHEERPVDSLPINPVARALPADFIETGITSIDLLNSLVRGQKLPIFSGGGLPHTRMAIDIIRHARLLSGEEEFALVFAGIGLDHGTARRIRDAVEDAGTMDRTVIFLNLADDSSTQRLLTPRYALTAAEYLAFTEGRHVLVVMTDMTSYCESLREVSASHGEIPARKGYPGHMYSDLSTLFERAGRLEGRPGTLTLLPILTMPGDDMTHPIPDLTGYITEGQIVLDRGLDRKGIFPPVGVLASLSRLMDQGIGEGFTHPDHRALAAQLYAAYARTRHVRMLASVVGEEGLPEADRRYLAFGEAFEMRLLDQRGPRSLSESMAVGWSLLRTLPVAELSRLSDEQIAGHGVGNKTGEQGPHGEGRTRR